MPKSHRAILHDRKRDKKAANAEEYHHPTEKLEQIHRVIPSDFRGKTLELFAGQGNLTPTYSQFGEVDAYDRNLGTGDSFKVFHRLIAEKRVYGVIDLDPYGFPNRLFPDVFLLIENGYIFITMPKPYCNFLNKMTQQHLECYYGATNPTKEQILDRLHSWGLCHWRELTLLDTIELGRGLWRFAFSVQKVKATDYCGVRAARTKIS